MRLFATLRWRLLVTSWALLGLGACGGGGSSGEAATPAADASPAPDPAAVAASAPAAPSAPASPAPSSPAPNAGPCSHAAPRRGTRAGASRSVRPLGRRRHDDGRPGQPVHGRYHHAVLGTVCGLEQCVGNGGARAGMVATSRNQRPEGRWLGRLPPQVELPHGVLQQGNPELSGDRLRRGVVRGAHRAWREASQALLRLEWTGHTLQRHHRHRGGQWAPGLRPLDPPRPRVAR